MKSEKQRLNRKKKQKSARLGRVKAPQSQTTCHNHCSTLRFVNSKAPSVKEYATRKECLESVFASIRRKGFEPRIDEERNEEFEDDGEMCRYTSIDVLMCCPHGRAFRSIGIIGDEDGWEDESYAEVDDWGECECETCECGRLSVVTDNQPGWAGPSRSDPEVLVRYCEHCALSLGGCDGGVHPLSEWVKVESPDQNVDPPNDAFSGTINIGDSP